ncbi:glutathione peroxidase [Paenibacillus sp. PsM32]|uniref:Glutathione peroxidase n=2 Tax=Paenibacillus TaxID=44249 RepID=A0ABW4UXQ9_9BACL|nr:MULTISPECIES: glutathione peroxidase [Paenibacillus]MDN4618726.1 glutathione peroxidase [Paenibacillus sp. PsM32]MDQ1236250.1 glutathione peroxidase [Paenibacillus sp. SORGH_AS_0306]MDR6108604.1 glutathione peroxidase [Paenibacillus sp. SORGH_AS_0338]WCT55689.1 glutathione peroxidase [Paenibacillus kyungheensis]WDF51146.1 glutathione peroxidase [Paenibacillus sp. KACC 21273]
MSVYDYSATTIDKEEKSLADYNGDVLLIVNTASGCGLTPQYEGLQKLYDTYQEQGFKVLGFPCNQFKGQEPGTEEDIKSFCQVNYNVSFPLFSKVDVIGETAHPLFQYLVNETPAPSRTGEIEWNFAKFLVDQKGNVVKQYPSRLDPAEVESDIQKVLAGEKLN